MKHSLTCNFKMYGVDRAAFLVLFQLSNTVHILNGSNDLPPKIWCSECTKYTNRTFKTFSISKNASSDENQCIRKIGNNYVCNDDNGLVTFTCEATYPITWKYPFTQMHDTGYTTISSFSRKEIFPVVERYRIRVHIRCTNPIREIYTLTCTSAEISSAKQSASFFMAVHAFESNEGWKRQKLVQVFAESEINHELANPLISPCLLSHRTVSLEKQDNSKWHTVNLKPNQLSVDPTIGYMFNTSNIPVQNLLGMYQCSYNGTNNKATFKISLSNETNTEFQSKSKISGNASVSLQLENKVLRIICCTGIEEKIPTLNMLDIDSQDNMNFWKHEILQPGSMVKWAKPYAFEYAESTECIYRHINQPRIPAIAVTCNGTNVDFQEIYVSVFSSFANDPVKERWKHILKQEGAQPFPKTALLMQYVPESAVATLPAKQKMFMAIAKRSTEDHRSIDGRTTTIFQEYDRDVFYEGEPISVLCFGLQFIHAKGGMLAIVWKNGSTSELQLESFDGLETQQILLNKVAFLQKTENVFAKSINASVEIASVKCWLPVARSRNWDNLTKTIMIEKPSFLEKNEETIYFSADKKEQMINCSVAEWEPSANISVFGNGNLLTTEWNTTHHFVKEDISMQNAENRVKVIGTWNYEDHIAKVQIKLFGVTSAYSGVFKCVADNGIMKATRTVRVTVGKQGHVMAIAITTAGLLTLAALLITGCIIKRKYYR